MKHRRASALIGGKSPVAVSVLPPDSRGYIAVLKASGAQFNVLFTRKGALRGGDVHPNEQLNYILKGVMRIVTPRKARNLTAGDSNFIPKGVPHYFKALEDCVMIEWWDGPFSCTYYPPYRKMVEASLI